jgi:choline dehydrogenase-like flavoprotein
MLRLREKDFQELEHAGGVSPAWPITYGQLAPYYNLAEQLYGIHGETGIDPTEPSDVPRYPYPALEHEPVIELVASALKTRGITPCNVIREDPASVVRRVTDFPAKCMPKAMLRSRRSGLPWLLAS